MADHIDEALVSILPDFSEFRQRYGYDLAAATRKDTVIIKVGLDSSRMKEDYALAMAAAQDHFSRVRNLNERMEQQLDQARRQAIAEDVRRTKAAEDEKLRYIKKAQAELERDSKKVVTLQTRLDNLKFKAELAEATKDQKIKLQTELDAAKVRLQIAELTQDRVIHFRAEVDKARAQLFSLINEGETGIAGGFGKGAAAAFGGISKLISSGSLRGFNIGDIASGFTDTFKTIEASGAGATKAFTAALAEAGPAAAAFAVVIAGLAASVLALGSSLGAAVVGLAAFSAAAVVGAAVVGVGLFAAFKRTTQAIIDFTKYQQDAQDAMSTGNWTLAIKDMDKYNAQFKQLTPAGQQFVTFVTGQLLPSLSVLSKISEDSFLPGIQRGLEKLFTLAPMVLAVIGQVGEKIGNLADKISGVFSGPKGSAELQRIFDAVLNTIDALTPAAVAFSDALLTIVSSAAPGLTSIAQWVADIAQQFNAWIQGLNNSGQLGQFFQEAAAEAKLWFNVIVEAGKAIFNILEPLLPIGHAIAEALLVALKAFNEFASSAIGSKIILIGIAVAAAALGGAILLLGGMLALAAVPFIAFAAVVAAIYEGLKAIGEIKSVQVAVHWIVDRLPQWAQNALERDNPTVTGTGHALGGTTPTTLASQLLTSQQGSDAEQAGQVVVNAAQAWKKAQEDQAKTARDSAHANVMADRAVRDSKQNLSDVFKSTAQANVDANTRVIDAETAVQKAHAATRKAQEDLTKARRDAVRALEDQTGKEHAAFIANERAKAAAFAIGLQVQGGITPEWQLRQLEIADELKSSSLNLDRTKTEGAELRARGVEGAPGVVSAKQALQDSVAAQNKADADLVKAYRDRTETFASGARARQKAQEAVNDAIYNQKKAHEDGAAANEQARIATDKAKVAYDNTVGSLANLATHQDNVTGKQKDLNNLFAQQMSLDTGNVPKQLQDIQTWIEALKLMSKDITMTSATAWTTAKRNVQQGTEGTMPSTGHGSRPDPRLQATGGPITGPGNGTSDSIRAVGPIPGVDYYLSNNEHIWTAAEVAGVGGHANVQKIRRAARNGQFQFAGGGGVHASIDGLAVGKALEDAGLLDQAAASAGALPKAGAAGPGFTLGQSAIAKVAYQVANAMRASARVLLALFETGLVESGFKNYANSNVPESLSIPHDAVGSDHRSVGFLQQQTPGWGSAAELMNAAIATRKFLAKAIGYDTSGFAGSAGRLAQKVQVSAFPDRYDAVQGQAMSLLNASRSVTLAPGAPIDQHYRVGDPLPVVSPAVGTGPVTGPGGAIGPGPGFPAWPGSAASVHGHDSGVWKSIINLANSWGLNPKQYGTLYQDRTTDTGGWSWHASGHAVDFMGYDQDALARKFMSIEPRVLELIHRTKLGDYGVSRGATHAMAHEWPLHRNHLHVAMARGGMVDNGVVVADRGAVLPPMSRTVVENRTGSSESVGFASRLDEYTIQRIIQALSSRPANLTVDREVIARIISEELGKQFGKGV